MEKFTKQDAIAELKMRRQFVSEVNLRAIMAYNMAITALEASIENDMKIEKHLRMVQKKQFMQNLT